MIINDDDDNKGNSILMYKLASLTAQWPFTKLIQHKYSKNRVKIHAHTNPT